MVILIAMDKWEVLVNSMAGIISNAENVQRKLGRESSKAIELYGVRVLKDLSEAIKENSGITRAPDTLRNYAWVYNKTRELKLPDDVTFSVCQLIAGESDPNHWADMILKEGMSGREVARLIRGARPKKKIICPLCKGSYEKS